MPDRRDEAWRYSALDEILTALDEAEPSVPDHGTPDRSRSTGLVTSVDELDRSVVDDLAGDHGGTRLVFVNGAFAVALSDLGPPVAGLWIGGADGLAQRRAPGAATAPDEPVDGFHALNWAAGVDVAAVLVDPEVHVDEPVHIVHLAAPGGRLTISHPRTVVRLGRASDVHLIESFAGIGGRAMTNASTRIVVGDDASCTHHRVVAESPRSIHVGRVGIDQSARSTVRTTSILTGGAIVRNAVDVHLGGSESRVDLTGLYLPTGHQRHDNVITVDHAASHCTSTQHVKGIVDGHGHGSFSGHVVVASGTVGTDARQSNPNLVLASTAQADTRPWLEIFADDVRCAHGATVGRLDEDALFYLRSRGIPVDAARSMLIGAFASEIVETLAPSSLREQVAAALAERTTGPKP